jgi:hypothetical protein
MSGEVATQAAGGPQAAGWSVGGGLPLSVRRRMAESDAREALESKRAAAELESRREESHQRALGLARELAESRGEVVDPLAYARGDVSPRPIGDIPAAAMAAAAVEDRRDGLRLHREGHGEPAKLHIEVGEPVIHHAPAARSGVGRAIASRARHFRDLLEARRRAELAERAVWESRNDVGIIDGVTPRPREDRGDVVFARHQYERPVSYR